MADSDNGDVLLPPIDDNEGWKAFFREWRELLKRKYPEMFLWPNQCMKESHFPLPDDYDPERDFQSFMSLLDAVQNIALISVCQ